MSLYAASWPSDRPTLSLTQGVGSSSDEEVVLACLCLDSNRALDRPDGVLTQTVRSFGATVFAALPPQFIRRIYKMDRRFIRRCQLHFASCVVYQLHRRYAPMVPLVHPTLCFVFLFFRGFDPSKIDYLLNLACGILASLGPRNVYKDMLNNMVSPIDHVVMNHQNHTQTNGI
jgi:hypothetical protein